MKIISFIYKSAVIKKILTHLNIYAPRSSQRAPPTLEPEYTEPVIVPSDDGLPEHEEAEFDFLKV